MSDAPGLVDFLRKLEKLYDAKPHLKYPSIAHLLLAHGHAYKTAPPLKKAGKLGLCYMNAYHLAERDPSLTYVEGYTATVGVPIEHAWCVDKDGNVYDPTLSHRACKDDWRTREYFGIPFKLSLVTKIIFKKKTYGVLDYHELYEKGLPEDA